MKLDLTKKLYLLDGKTAITVKDENGVFIPFMMKDAMIQALLATEDKETPENKSKDWEIIKKLRDAKKEIELTIEEVALIKKKVGLTFTTLVMGQIFDYIEG